MHTIEITPASTPRGKARAIVHPQTPYDRRKRVAWRTQVHRCCGQTWARWDASEPGPHAPVCSVENAEHGLMGEVSQCGTCGDLHELRFTVRNA